MNYAINGMGVLGRELFRRILSTEGSNDDVVVINDPNVTAANLAYLLKYDSVYGVWEKGVAINEATGDIQIDGKDYHLYAETDVINLPLGEKDARVVFECTGKLTAAEAQGFIDAGASKVVMCYPVGNSVKTITYGVNQNEIEVNDNIISAGDIETQVAALVYNSLLNLDEFVSMQIDVFTAYTNAQNTMDSLVNDNNYALGRAAAWNITPLANTLAETFGYVITAPVEIISETFRAPIIAGGAMRINGEFSTDGKTAEDINQEIRAQANENITAWTAPACSSDVVGSTYTAVVLEESTQVNGKKCSLTILLDNIRGFAENIMRTGAYIGAK